jgi:hypothetical protein
MPSIFDLISSPHAQKESISFICKFLKISSAFRGICLKKKQEETPSPTLLPYNFATSMTKKGIWRIKRTINKK